MKRLNLSDLKVKSFVTSVKEDNVDTVKGGTLGRQSGFQIICDSSPQNCPEPTAQGCGGTNGCGTFPATCRPSGFQIICDTTINC